MNEHSNNVITLNPQVEGGLTVHFKNESSILSDNEISQSHKLAHVLRRIHDDLVSNGYTITDGKIYFDGKQVFEKITKPQMFWHKKSQERKV
jgi:hypothetical protein